MMKTTALAAWLILVAAAPSIAGENPNAKLAMHVVASGEYLYCVDLTPAACESINVDVSVEDILASGGYGYVAFVAYDVAGIAGAEFAVSGWPSGRGAPPLSGPYWCPEGALTMGDHLGSGGIVSFPCDEASPTGLVHIGYCSFGPLDEADLPITLEYTPSSFSYPNDAHNYVLDCTVNFEEDSVLVATGCTIGGTYLEELDCVGQLGGEGLGEEGGEDAGGFDAGSVTIADIIEITDGSEYSIAPRWSPDGSKILFSRSQYQGIYMANADGTGPVVELTDLPYSGYRPQWTPDSRRIILRVRTGVRSHAIKVLDVETREIHDLVTGLRTVGPLETNRRGDIFLKVNGRRKVLDLVGRELVDPVDYYSGLPEGASGDKVIEIDVANSTVWIMKSDGSERVRFPHSAKLAKLSPAGDKICFHPAGSRLCVANLDGTGVVDLGLGSGESWSPSGRHIVYQGAFESDHWGNITRSELFIANADGSAMAQLTNMPDVVESLPSWSPEGMRIAYDDAKTGKIFVAVLEVVE